MKFMHLGEKTGDDNRPTHSNIGVKSRGQANSTRQALQSWQVAFQDEAFLDVPIGSADFGGSDEFGVVHSDTNPFRVFAILRNPDNGQFNRYRLPTIVKHVGMCKKG
ncbi:hypothetical protein TNCV_3846281 [Trichonephila clavipes]|nr:hypothetical protein TNCV_3846281 [Trichonephila clavipes]